MTLENNGYDSYWEARNSNNFNLNDYQFYRYNWFLRRVKRSFSLTDIGCGNGAIVKEILKNNSESIIHIHAVDSSKKALSKINDKRIKKYSLNFTSPNKILKLPKSDYILLFEVIEHVAESELLLLNSLNIANNAVFFSIPNTGYFSYRVRLLFGKFPCQWKIKPNEHLRFWTLKDLRWWLSELELIEKSEICTYKGVPLLNILLPNLFAAGIIVKIDK